MNRVETSAVVVHAVKGLEPRAPELEIPRPSGAGVGVGLLARADGYGGKNN